MLDIGFSEILLTSAIALVVLGPERLPRVARQVGNWMGRARSMARQLTEQLEREVSADDLLREEHKTKAMAPNRIAPLPAPPPLSPQPLTVQPLPAVAEAYVPDPVPESPHSDPPRTEPHTWSAPTPKPPYE